MKLSDDRRIRIYGWCEQDKETRQAQTEFRKDLHISYPRFAQIVQDWKVSKEFERQGDKHTENIRAIMQATLGDGGKVAQLAKKVRQDKKVVDEIFEQPEEMRKQTILALFDKAIKKQDHNAAFRLAQIMGWIVEQSKHEVTIKLSADEITRRNLEAERELEQWRGERGHRVEEVQKEPSLLLE